MFIRINNFNHSSTIKFRTLGGRAIVCAHQEADSGPGPPLPRGGGPGHGPLRGHRGANRLL